MSCDPLPTVAGRVAAEGKLVTQIKRQGQPFVDEPYFVHPKADPVGFAVGAALGNPRRDKPVQVGHVRTLLRWIKP